MITSRRRPARPGLGLAATLLLAALGPACRGGDQAPPAGGDAARPRRVIDRPVSSVHPLPPHAIRDGSVGPYRVGEQLSAVLAQLPSGPRVAVLDVPGVVRVSVIRAEGGKILVGGPPLEPTSFVSVAAPEVARTERGHQVGSTLAAVLDELGPALAPAAILTDPRLVRPSGLPSARLLVEPGAGPAGGSDGDGGRRVAAVILTAAAGATAPAPVGPDASVAEPVPALACSLPEPAAIERLVEGVGARYLGCLDAGGLYLAGDELLVLAGGDRPRRVTSVTVPGLVFAGLVRVGERVELAAVRRQRGPGSSEWLVLPLRLEAGRLVRGADERAYQLTQASAGWIGATLDDLDLALEVEVSAEVYVVRGFLLTRSQARLRDVVPLLPRVLARRRRGVEPAAGTVDASTTEVGGQGAPAHTDARTATGPGDGIAADAAPARLAPRLDAAGR